MQLIERDTLRAAGHVQAWWVDRSRGLRIPACDRHNVILYSAADVMATILAGDSDAIPGFVGYVYAPDGETIPNPASDPAPRHFGWTDIKAAATLANGDIIVSPLESVPLITASSGDYSGNVVTYTSMSDITAIPVNGSPAPKAGADRYFQVALLSRVFVLGSPTYVPFAYTQLAAGDTGVIVLSGMELAVTWTITLK